MGLGMLRNTFLHLPGVGEKTERRLWDAGYHTWDELLSAPDARWPAKLRGGVGPQWLEEGRAQYEAASWRYFDTHLPGGAKWRAYAPLKDNVLYVDIETDGYANNITVIGIYDGHCFRAFVADENLEESLPVLEAASLIVTYNGTGFDMPIIRSRFPYHLFNHVHIDLMWPLRKLGLRGGLKQIERQMGLARSEETHQMSGMDAVYLWQAYQRGSQEAKQRLLQYNEEDVRNLEPLMQWVDRQCRAALGLTLRP